MKPPPFDSRDDDESNGLCLELTERKTAEISNFSHRRKLLFRLGRLNASRARHLTRRVALLVCIANETFNLFDTNMTAIRPLRGVNV